MSILSHIPTWVMMSPILFLSILALAVIIERFLFYRKNVIDHDSFINTIVKKIKDDRILEAKSMCEATKGPLSNVVLFILANRSFPEKVIREKIDDRASYILKPLEKYIGILATIASISPLFGLLGTVTGLIQSFNVLSIHGTSASAELAAGISQALYTTAAGLIVAIPSLIFYNYFTERMNFIIRDIDIGTIKILEALKRIEKQRN